MSRGGLLLRHVRENRELNYINGTMLTEYKLNRPQIDSQLSESPSSPLKNTFCLCFSHTTSVKSLAIAKNLRPEQLRRAIRKS